MNSIVCENTNIEDDPLLKLRFNVHQPAEPDSRQDSLAVTIEKGLVRIVIMLEHVQLISINTSDCKICISTTGSVNVCIVLVITNSNYC